MTSKQIPTVRIRRANDAPQNDGGRYVLYWMIAARRTKWNFALQRAVEWARELDRPLLVLEPLRAGYRWASVRHHQFVLRGMRDNAAACDRAGVRYYPYVEPSPGDGSGLLEALAAKACVVVTDEFPAFFLPRMVAAAAKRLDVTLEQIDGCGLLPLRATDKVFPTAYAFRRFLQRNLPEHLDSFPRRNPLARSKLPRLERMPASIGDRWPPCDAIGKNDEKVLDWLGSLPIDQEVAAVENAGGAGRGSSLAKTFVEEKLDAYDEARNEPGRDATSGLSPYLHFGHVSPHEVFDRLRSREDWTPLSLSDTADGSRSGWWGTSAGAEAFLDQLVTWRELGFNMSSRRDDHDRFDSLPDWALKTLEEHAGDPREHVYTLKQFEAAATHDPLWNAAQIQLRREGTIHNYLRMLWGKKILHWSKSPRAALDVMVELNNKYALDGRDPNSYSGIFWTLGRYDRPWGPERPIFGKVRYMTSANTARKYNVKDYLKRYAADDRQRSLDL